MTFNELVDAALADSARMVTYAGKACRKSEGEASFGRFGAKIVPCGRPSVGQSSAVATRLDCYIDGKRVKRAVLQAAMAKGAGE